MNIIEDRKGRRYLVAEYELLGGLRFLVQHQERLIAYANLRFEGDKTLYLADLHVSEKVILPAKFTCIWGFPPANWRTSNFRRLGIGSAIIDLIKGYAQTHGFQQIKGRMTSDDIAAYPLLSDWYQERGFVVSHLGTGASREISLRIQDERKLRIS